MISASARGLDITELRGALALHLVSYRPSGSPMEGAAVPDLVVEHARSGQRATFHATTGLYGFTNLSRSRHRIHIRDPRDQYLPRALVAALDLGEPPQFVTVPMRFSGSRRPGSGETAVWGWVADDDKRPLPFARLAVSTTPENGDEIEIVTYTGLDGSYLAVIPGVGPAQPAEDTATPATDDSVPPTVSDSSPGNTPPPPRTAWIRIEAHRLRNGPSRGPKEHWLAMFPADFDDLVFGTAGFDATYVAHRNVHFIEIPAGSSARVDFAPESD